MDLFAKIEKNANWRMSQEAKAAGAYPYFHELRSGQDTVVDMEGRRTIMLGSNNYLGLTSHPKVKAAGVAALEKYGSGCSGSRFLNGTLDIHAQLERELADFLHKDAAVTFGTGFQSNLGILGTIASLGDYILCDKENHASIYDGCKLSYAKMVRYEHSDMADLEKRLRAVPETAGALIVTDGVFSMSGDICNLPEIVALAKSTARASWWTTRTGWACSAKRGAARRSTSGWKTKWISSWALFPSRSPASAGTWRRGRTWSSSSASIRARSFSARA